ncbi:LysR family transcriptional regulator [Verticiella sediminum]|uniref:LysR family transcriptional regulator n=1 Tax=Verticiella sediminum TaxID=1247510 RepID=A0A556ARL7_9BURK|nr:LysR family transcriptional regulator [Verticiella sediminum]TSH95566.1 LysR family transcriptional regulator [Verticiella sediminum]
MPNCSPDDMLLFAKAAQLRSISAAARMLDKPKSTVSRAIMRLENALGARLMDRSSRNVALTDAGRVFLQHCHRVSQEVTAGVAAVGELQGNVRGRLRVAVPTTFGLALLSSLVAPFLLTYRDLTLELRLTDRSQEQIEERFDVTVRAGPLPPSSLIARELGTNRYGVYASPAYLAAHPPILEPQDLAIHRVVDSFSGAEAGWWGFRNKEGDTRVQVQPRADINDALMRREAAVQGVGPAIVPTWIATEAVRAGRLRPVLPDWVSTRTLTIFALWSGREHMPPRLRVFIDYLVDAVPRQFANDPPLPPA